MARPSERVAGLVYAVGITGEQEVQYKVVSGAKMDQPGINDLPPWFAEELRQKRLRCKTCKGTGKCQAKDTEVECYACGGSGDARDLYAKPILE